MNYFVCPYGITEELAISVRPFFYIEGESLPKDPEVHKIEIKNSNIIPVSNSLVVTKVK